MPKYRTKEQILAEQGFARHQAGKTLDIKSQLHQDITKAQASGEISVPSEFSKQKSKNPSQQKTRSVREDF